VATDTERHLRVDALRNADRILRAARVVFAETGPDASLEDVARQAGVGIRTLYRRFPAKADLVRAVLDQSIAEDLAPAIDRALADPDPRQGFVGLVDAAMSLAAREHSTFTAARITGSLPVDVSTAFYETLSGLLHRAQEAGGIRADLVPDDLPRIMAMLFSTLWNMDSDRDGWRRYLALLLDGLLPAAAHPLPPAAGVSRGPGTR
jgi:AcrR family transcriptional regulator